MKKLISLILAAVCISSLWTVSAYDVYYFYDEYGNPVFMFPDTFYEIIPDETPAEVDEPVAEEVPIEELFPDGWFDSEPSSSYSKNGTDLRTNSSYAGYSLKWNQHPKAATYRIYFYNEKTGKYAKKYDESYNNFWGTYYLDSLASETTYKIMLREYDKNGDMVNSKKVTLKTDTNAPNLAVTNNGKKPKLKVTTDSKKATGVEVYYKVQSIDKFEDSYYYGSYTLDELKDKGFKLLKRSSDGKTLSLTLKAGKTYTVAARTFYVNNGKRVYSPFTELKNTSSTEALINGLTLKSRTVTSGNELKLVKKYVDSTINSKMSNYEKLSAIFDIVHSHGNYQNDINKIDGNRPVWQIMEKQEGQCASWAFCLYDMLEYAGFDIQVVRGTRPSGQHFWCRIKLDGKWYNLDAHLGAFLTKTGDQYYEKGGDYQGYTIVETF